MKNLRIAYSHGNSILPRLIRWFTRSDVNHCLFLVEEGGVELVIGADWNGLVVQTRANFEKRGVTIKYVPPLLENLDEHIPELLRMLDTPYDYTGLVGMIPVEIARFWFHKRIHNPLHSRAALFCSETAAKFLKMIKYKGAEVLDPPSVDPGFLKDWQYSQTPSVV